MKKCRWPGRVLRGLRLDRNPLRRTLDRVEAFIFCGLIVAAVAAAPVAALGASHWAYGDALRLARAEQQSTFQERAVLLAAPATTSGYAVATAGPAPARWRTPAGGLRTGSIEVPASAARGQSFPVWVDKAGSLAMPPLTAADAAAQGTFASVMAVMVTLVACMTAALVTRMAVNRRRLAAWEADWLVTAPKWNRQHW